MLIDHLKQTFADRCRKNPAYSLRAFSRSLGIDSSTVSGVLSGKRPLTLKLAKKIVAGLNITNPVEAQALIVNSLTGSEENSATARYQDLAMEAAEALAGWQHFAILALLELDGFQGQDRTIATRLNIPLGIASECLGRIEKLGLIVKKDNFWVLTGKNMATQSMVPSAALREGHRQNILKALHSLDNDPLEIRDVSGITMAVSTNRLVEAKKMIQDFRRRLSTFMEDEARDAVYRLNIQLFPLTQEKK